jgi:hypothetical protein
MLDHVRASDGIHRRISPLELILLEIGLLEFAAAWISSRLACFIRCKKLQIGSQLRYMAKRFSTR